MSGILSAIAAPGWLAFNNRQRLNKANDAVLSALQDAQRQAKKTKLSYSVSFISDPGKVPQVAIYTGSAPPPLSDPRWKNLGQDIALKPGQVLLYTNIDPSTANQAVSPSSLSMPNSPNPTTITFDYMGSLPNFASPSGLKVVVAQATSINSNNVVKRCVIVQTLLGAMQTAKSPPDNPTDGNCN